MQVVWVIGPFDLVVTPRQEDPLLSAEAEGWLSHFVTRHV